jgi:hypothetical protein
VLWAAGVPLGVDRELLEEFHAPGWGSLYILGLVVLIEGTALWTHLFIRSRAAVVPHRLPLAGGRRVKPWMVIAPLLIPIAILAEFNLFTITVLLGGNDFGPGVPDWSLALQAAVFGVWGVTLTVATLAYLRDVRRTPTSRAPVAGSEPVAISSSSAPRRPSGTDQRYRYDPRTGSPTAKPSASASVTRASPGRCSR